MDGDVRDLIRWFGFTEKEAEVYLAILEHGPGTIQNIVQRSDVSRRHVYNTVERLEEYNLVIVNDYITPATVEPAPPNEVQTRLEEKADELYRQLEQQYQQRVEIIDDIKVLKSRSTVIQQIRSMIDSAEERIAISIPTNVLPNLRESLKDAVERDVAVLLLVFENRRDEAAGLDVPLKGLAHVIRYGNRQNTIRIAVDRVSALVAPQDVFSEPHAQTNAVFLGQPYLEPIVFTSLMNISWELADEAHVESPTELPSTYTNFRRAVIDAALHKRFGEDVRAVIEARSREDPETIVELIGEVAELEQRFIEPISDTPSGYCCMNIRGEDGTASIGGQDALMEGYRAYSTRLELIK
jgi:sugar-specific transcriptional regulator TrmB